MGFKRLDTTQTCYPGVLGDGLWAEWSQWSTCSKNCSGGTKLRARACAYEPGHPRGKACEGDSVEQASCNTQECPGNEMFDFKI